MTGRPATRELRHREHRQDRTSASGPASPSPAARARRARPLRCAAWDGWVRSADDGGPERGPPAHLRTRGALRPAAHNDAVAEPSIRRDIELLVQAQGVERPFRILLGMPEQSRLMIGRLLGCSVRPGDPPDVQAHTLISQNLRGLQARTHRLVEQLTPFSRNNNWWEIVTRTARRLGLRFYPGLKDEEVEQLVFDHLAAQYVRQHVRDGEDPDRFLAELDPHLGRAIASLGLSRTGKRALVASLLRTATDAPDDPREGANRLADWVRRAKPWWSWTTSIGTGLRLLQQRLGDIAEGWMRTGLLPWAPGNWGRVGTVLAVLYLHDLVQRTIDQVDLVGS